MSRHSQNPHVLFLNHKNNSAVVKQIDPYKKGDRQRVRPAFIQVGLKAAKWSKKFVIT